MRFFKVRFGEDDYEDDGEGGGMCRIGEDLPILYEDFDKAAVVSFRQERRVRLENQINIVTRSAMPSMEDVEAIARRAYDLWGLSGTVRRLKVEECSIADELQCFGSLELQYVQAGLFELNEVRRHRAVFRDYVVSDHVERDEALARCARTEYSAALGAELGRIYEGAGAGAGRPGCRVPAHYLVEGSSAADYDSVLDVLLPALGTAGRLPSTHVFRFDCDRHASEHYSLSETMLPMIDKTLADSLEGNVIVIAYGVADDGSTYDDMAYAILQALMRELVPILDTTQVVLLTPSGNADVRRRVARLLAAPLVPILRNARPSARKGLAASKVELGRMATARGMKPDAALGGLLERRMEDESFDDLDAVLEQWSREKVARERYPQYLSTVEGYYASRADEKGTPAMERLDSLVGLEGPKRLIKDAILRFRMNKEVAAAGLPVQPFSLHLAFMGAPGTGKTEVARLYGEILKDEGILKEGRVITVSGASLRDKDLEHARGSIVFIDEAYGLLCRADPIVTTLIAYMENHRDDTVVILAGYEDEMNRLLDSNPGFRSRLGYRIAFPDYTADELLRIFQLMCSRAELVLPKESLDAVRDVLARGGRREDQGNARYVRKLFEDAVGAQQVRLATARPEDGYTRQCLETLLPQDLGYEPLQKEAKTARVELEELIGLDGVKRMVEGRLDLARVEKVRRDRGMVSVPMSMHMAFMGNPGTGKTEVARLVGRILHEEGLLSVGDFYECGRQDLVGTTVGSTAPKVAALFRRARGSVIFIDEAYSLIDDRANGFGDEAIAAIIDQMEKLRDDVVVILAGYTDEIGKLLSLNPGFASRVPTRVVFPDYSAAELERILELMASREGLVLGEGVAERVMPMVGTASRQEGFGNARYVRNLLDDARVAQGTRLAARLGEGELVEGELSTLLPEDFVEREVPKSKARMGFV